MSNFLPQVKKEYEFEGDIITAEFKRLTRKQMLKISPYIPSPTGEKDGDGKAIMESQTTEEVMKMLDTSIEALEENMGTFKGLKDADGSELEFENIVKESYFTKLLSAMATDLISESMVEEKKQGS